MVIIKTPLRICLAGGGTDLPVWYKNHGSTFISATIDKYIYTTLHRSKYNPNIRLRYSKMEEVSHVDHIEHEIFRETLKRYGVTSHIEVTTHAEIPSGTGLGSSGSFGVGLVHALNPEADREFLAKEATEVQMNLGYPIGLQDQYAAAYGGIREYKVSKKGEVSTHEIEADDIQEKLVMLYTGIKRDTNEVLKQSKVDGLEFIQEIGSKIGNYLEAHDYDPIGKLFNEHWEYKKKRGGMTNPQIDEWYKLGLEYGALGGKLIGAGGGGFLLFYTNDRQSLIDNMPLLHQPFGFDYQGSTNG